MSEKDKFCAVLRFTDGKRKKEKTMEEKIYTIPVNEAFEQTDGCPFCRLFRKLEDDELELVELKHYLALNFEARMRILSFSLYTRIDNLNHSLYEPASGYRPEGVRFLYGITWSFDN